MRLTMSNVDTLKKNIADNEFERLYFLFGEESYLREYYKSQIISAFENDGFADFNTLICEADSTSAEEIEGFFDGLPMMAPRKLLVINDLDIGKLNENMKEKLPKLLADIPDYLTVIFYYSSSEYKPDKRLTIWKLIDKNGIVCNVERAARSDLVAWIKRRFKAWNKTISTENAEYLMFLCGDLMVNLISEIEKIASGTNTDEIQKRHIDLLASPTLEAQIFDLGEMVTSKKHKEALEILDKLIKLRYEPIAINAVLSKQLGRLYMAKLALNSGKSEDYIAKLCGFKSKYPATLLCKSARKCSLEWTRKAVKACYQNDLEMKSNIPDNERKLFILLCSLAQEGK